MTTATKQEILDLAASDEYRFSTLEFSPDVIYDIGADVGSISLIAAKYHPESIIVSVEPNPWSYGHLKSIDNENIIAVNAAIGQGQMFQPKTERHPLNFIVVGKESANWNEEMVPLDVNCITIADLYEQYGGSNYAIKIDCESAEIEALRHAPSRRVMLGASYFTAEFHIWHKSASCIQQVADEMHRFIHELAQTHAVDAKFYGACIMIWAKKQRG